MQALHEVVQSGKVRYIGMSSCWAWQFQRMQSESTVLLTEVHHHTDELVFSAYAIENHLTPFISMQNHYSALYREEEREMMPMLKHYGVGTVPWGPLAAGRECSAGNKLNKIRLSETVADLYISFQYCAAQSRNATRPHAARVSRNTEEAPRPKPQSSMQ